MKKGNTESAKVTSNRSFFIVLVIVVASLILMRVFLVDWISISGESMLPTIYDGEYVLAEKVTKRIQGLEYHDIVIVQYPNGLQCVKRVVGKPGDTVHINGSTLYINGEVQPEPYLASGNFQDMKHTNVPPDSFFVMGDNRNFSSDSRNPDIGPIPYDRIVGKVVFVIFPFGQARRL